MAQPLSSVGRGDLTSVHSRSGLSTLQEWNQDILKGRLKEFVASGATLKYWPKNVLQTQRK